MAATTARRGLRRDQESLTARRIVVTTGEPAGIGPDLSLAAALVDWPCELVFVGDPASSPRAPSGFASRCGPTDWREAARPVPHRAGTLPVLASTLAREASPGRPDPANARYVLATIDAAAEGCLAGRFDAMVTAPVQKASINDAGIPFTGPHRIPRRKERRRARRSMLLVAGTLRVALATTHLPLVEVSPPSHARIARADARRARAGTARVASASTRRASSSAGSIRMPAKAGHLGREEIESHRAGRCGAARRRAWH